MPGSRNLTIFRPKTSASGDVHGPSISLGQSHRNTLFYVTRKAKSVHKWDRLPYQYFIIDAAHVT